MTWLSDGNPLGEDNPVPAASAPATPPSPEAPLPEANTHLWPLVVAILWGAVAVSVGLYFAFGVQAEEYTGDAYTGIEAAIVTAVKGIGWLLISSGVLGIVIAGHRDRPDR